MFYRFTFVYLSSLLLFNGVSSLELSLPQYDADRATRDAAITEVASAIKNEKRFHVVDGVAYPIIDGPIPRNGSLTQLIAGKESLILEANENKNLSVISSVANLTAPHLKSLSDYDGFYQKLQPYIPRPIAAIEPTGDDAFGQDRLTMNGMRLKQVRIGSKFTQSSMTYRQVKNVCGYGMQSLIRQGMLFDVNLAFASQYNDPKAPHKYAPGVIGYFCVTTKRRFVPLMIHIIDTDLVYSPYDTPNEWILAKMALNTAEMNVQQHDHFMETHMILEPIRVELLRTVSKSHPIHVLLEHHFTQLFFNTIAGLNSLFSKGSAFDSIFGWGATGTLRFIGDTRKHASFADDFTQKIRRNRLQGIPNYKSRDDSKVLLRFLRRFLHGYLRAYYRHHSDVLNDDEIQKWAKETAKTTKGFPSKIYGFHHLVETLSNIIFRVSVEHHNYNSNTVWDAFSLPYSVPSLWSPLPKEKGVQLDLKKYTLPNSMVPAAIGLFAFFYRPMNENSTNIKSYKTIDLGSSSAKAVDEYCLRMEQVDAFIKKREDGEERPFVTLRPSRLPYYVWV